MSRTSKACPNFLARAPNVRLKFLATNARTIEVLASLGLDSILCSPAAFVDEFEMVPVVPQRKSWDAIYNARFIPVKRHELAAQIQSLALIGAPCGATGERLTSLRRALPHAHYANFGVDGSYKNFNHSEVRDHLNRARTGLILSETEGANLATIEYLLCGVPVVTTPPQGGRELFLPPAVCEIAEPSATSVVDAVRRLIRRNLDPFAVRQTALDLMMPHRRAFLRELAHILGPGIEAKAAARTLLAGLPYALSKNVKLPSYGL